MLEHLGHLRAYSWVCYHWLLLCYQYRAVVPKLFLSPTLTSHLPVMGCVHIPPAPAGSQIMAGGEDQGLRVGAEPRPGAGPERNWGQSGASLGSPWTFLHAPKGKRTPQFGDHWCRASSSSLTLPDQLFVPTRLCLSQVYRI